jgi:hypothetical protein
MMASILLNDDALAKCKKSRSGGGSNNMQTIAQANVVVMV